MRGMLGLAQPPEFGRLDGASLPRYGASNTVRVNKSFVDEPAARSAKPPPDEKPTSVIAAVGRVVRI